jgi:hypothetical protein
VFAYKIVFTDTKKNIYWEDSRLCLKKPSDEFIDRLSELMGLQTYHQVDVRKIIIDDDWE